MFSSFVLGLTATTLLFAGIIHLLLRVGEALERRGRIPSRDMAVAPGLILLIALMALALGPAGSRLGVAPADLAIAAILGLKIGSVMPRPARNRRARRL
ncbi:MAG TPA: hypothetical protein VL574_13515 [Stellaceae bacterium]|jgi:hypothetical protein|nr:hypothetical protein [Stellaceae bacterium]